MSKKELSAQIEAEKIALALMRDMLIDVMRENADTDNMYNEFNNLCISLSDKVNKLKELHDE